MKTLSTLAVCCWAAAAAAAAPISFASLTNPLYPSGTTITSGGVALTITTEGAPSGNIVTANLSGAVRLEGAASGAGFTPLRFTFSEPVTSITFGMGDPSADDDGTAIFEGFSASGSSLGSVSVYIGTVRASINGYFTGSGTFANASYFILSTTATPITNSIYWTIEDVQFATSPVPEPGSALLLGSTLALAGAARRFSRK